MLIYSTIIASTIDGVDLLLRQRHITLDILLGSSHTTMEAKDEYCYTASDPRAGGTVTPQSSGSDRASLRRPRAIFPSCRQDSSEVRDAARTSCRRTQRDGGRRATWLLAGRVLSDCRCIFRGRYAWATRRAPWPARSTQV